eukprot:TRINITY_DN67641_c0_g1_i1.p1 TRINITY_DN67641_c0_g1~~TRINITY_DN67641_c0_g1_i1.p1  ORF type:complete len:481 (+),score=45.19 TRINITY_DN67641_c0_g1_i1:48-1445(+)
MAACRGPRGHEKGPASKGVIAGRPSSKGSLSSAGRHCVGRSSDGASGGGGGCNVGSNDQGNSNAHGGVGEQPEWGSSVASYGRDCMTSAPRHRGGADVVPGDDRRSNGDDCGTNETSYDNPLSLLRASPLSCKTHPCESDPLLARRGHLAQGRSTPSRDKPQHVTFDVTKPPCRLGPTEQGETPFITSDDHSSPSRPKRADVDGFADCGAPRISQWTCAMVQSWLVNIGLGCLARRFAEEAIDGEALLECREEDLMVLGVERLGDRKKLMKQIRLAQADGANRACSPPNANRVSSSFVNVGSVTDHDYPVPESRQMMGGSEPNWAGGGHVRSGNRSCDGSEPSFSLEASCDKSCARNDSNPSRDAGSPLAATGASDPHSNAASVDNPLVPTNRCRPAKDPERVSGAHGKSIGKDKEDKSANFTSADNPLACGNYWGDVRGLPERPRVHGEVKQRGTWRDDFGTAG